MTTSLLIGNPNTGKTSLFNALTTSYAYVGNWTGVTVDKKVGQLKNKLGQLVDLPGVYDLRPVSADESVVSNALLQDSFDQFVNIVDASQLERNFQLTLQLLEYNKPIVIALNMMDVAQKRGITIDFDALANRLNVPIYQLVARKETGKEALLEGMRMTKQSPNFQLNYPSEIETTIEALIPYFTEKKEWNARWLAIQFLYGNITVETYLREHEKYASILALREKLQTMLSEPIAAVIFKTREKYIQELMKEISVVNEDNKTSKEEKIDRIVTSPILGIPLFMLVMFLVFQVTFTWIGAPLSDLLDGLLSGPVSSGIESILISIGASTFLQQLVLDGIVAGVGGVLVFVPQIFVLFFCISLLEDSGYMSRIAVIMDSIMEKFDLNGKSFIPMIISFGCNVPGIMAARTIEQRKERLLTILIAPFMSCSARLPVYALFVGAFFVQYQAIVVFSLYFLGIILALVAAKIISITFLKEETSMFFIDLPMYNVPHAKTLWRSTWEKGKGFIRKAGTIIFAGSLLIWMLSYAGPKGMDVPMDTSFMAIIGGFIAPIFAPLGFGTWQAASSLLTGFLAKEVVVSAMSIIYAVTENELTTSLMAYFTPVSAYAFLVFVLLYVPCLATVAVIARETKSAKWTTFSIIYPLVTAWIITFVVYRVGLLFFS
ncbi:ferrous iron transport protein B [Paenisporosarcina cavernae]|uniref:Ferrous iron transport protein B n=1 Tax=Paenisporosarcina cavernae TaxID=2320858 RepID=A0A385YSE9_9BACL|nr:ferrous iron transport protein B [Paenisporosarcina cavernae]AYC28598.1 ferrous iron transport protein B [Paenisporosarcina cavernae]